MDDGVRHKPKQALVGRTKGKPKVEPKVEVETNAPLWGKRKEGPSPEVVGAEDENYMAHPGSGYVSPFKHGGPGCERCFGIPGDQLERLKRLYEMPEPRLTRKEKPLWAMLREEYPGGVSHVALAARISGTDSALRMAIRRLRDKLPRGVTIDNDYGSYRIVVHV